MGEYGDPDKPEEWEFVKTISPYHNIADNREEKAPYPDILFTTYVWSYYACVLVVVLVESLLLSTISLAKPNLKFSEH